MLLPHTGSMHGMLCPLLPGPHLLTTQGPTPPLPQLPSCTQSNQADTGHAVGLAGSLLLTGVMGARFAKTKKLMPAGLLAATGLLGSVYNYQKWVLESWGAHVGVLGCIGAGAGERRWCWLQRHINQMLATSRLVGSVFNPKRACRQMGGHAELGGWGVGPGA